MGHNMTMTMILYHGNCPDGFGSAWLASKYVDAELVPMTYEDPIPAGVDGQIVFLLDFCFRPDQLIELCERAAAVRILDHHQTGAEYLAEVEPIITVYASMNDMPEVMPRNWAWIDMKHSGVGLTQLWFDAHHWFLDRIEDRDLWNFKVSYSAEVFAAVTSMPYAIEAWDEIAATRPMDLIEQGGAIVRYRDQQIAAAVEAAWQIDLPGVGLIPIAPCAYSIGSEVAGKLAELHPSKMGAYFIPKQTSVRLGFRSRDDGPDVAELAKRWDGGGHKAAAGLEVSLEEFASWTA